MSCFAVTRLAQFKADNIWNDVHVLLQQDVVQTKKDVPKALLRQDDLFAFGVSSFLSFGYEGNSPFKDQRLRQAMSMLLDREGFIDVRAALFQRGIYDPVLVRFDTATVTQASTQQIAEQLAVVAESLA